MLKNNDTNNNFNEQDRHSTVANYTTVAEENPDLPYGFIKSVLKAKSEIDNGDVSTFESRYK